MVKIKVWISPQAEAVVLSSHPLGIYLPDPSQKRPKPLYSSLAVRGEGGSTNSHILRSLKLPLLLWLQDLQYKRFCAVTIWSRKGMQWSGCVGHTSRFLLSWGFAPNTPQLPWLHVQGHPAAHTSSVAWKNKFFKHTSNYWLLEQINVC